MADEQLSHIDGSGNPRMVDVGEKTPTKRSATACSVVRLPEAVRACVTAGEIEGPKGPVFQTARIAGVMAVKRTHELIPFCHPLGVERCDMEITLDDAGDVRILCTVAVEGKTGVEMEALTGVSVAALTIYDMCKALSHDIVISDTRLLKKTGGKSDIAAE